MKKMFLPLLLVITLVSCSTVQKAQPLRYQSLPMVCEADYESDAGTGRVKIDCASTQDYTVSFLSPDIMRGVTYEYLDGKSYMCFGDSRIPTGEAPMPRGMLACARLFMLDPTKAGEPTPTESGELIYTLSYEGIQATVTEREGAPVKIEGRVNGFTCTYTNIEITYG